MEKNMCYAALGVAGLMGLLFVLDLATGFIFGGGPFTAVDIIGIIVAGIVGYLGYSSLKDIR